MTTGVSQIPTATQTRREILARGLALGLVWPLLAAFDKPGHLFHWFQKLTVTVDTPNGPKTCAAVVEVHFTFYRKEVSITRSKLEISGEAGCIEITPGKYLFSLLKGFDEKTIFTAFIRESSASDNSDDAVLKRFSILDTFQTKTRTLQLPSGLYPVFATFRDIADPETLVIVDPQNLAEHFGPGVELSEVRLTVSSRETFPDQVRKVIPWLATLRQQRGSILSASSTYALPSKPEEHISISDFITSDRWSGD